MGQKRRRHAGALGREGMLAGGSGSRRIFFSVPDELIDTHKVAKRAPQLAIPNQTVKRVMYGYLRDAYRDGGVLGQPVPLRAVDDGDGQPRRVAAAAGVSERGDRAAA